MPHPRLVLHFDGLLRGIYDALRGVPPDTLPTIEPVGDEWLAEMIEIRHYDLQVATRQRMIADYFSKE